MSQQRIVEFDEKMAFADAEERMDLVDQLISLGLTAPPIKASPRHLGSISRSLIFGEASLKGRDVSLFFRFYKDLENQLTTGVFWF